MSCSNRFRVMAAAAAFVVPSSVGAQQARDSVRLKELVVTASREALPARVRATAADVLPAEERARRQITRLSDALRLMPGLGPVGTGGLGGTTSLFTRGVNSNQTLLIIDGIRVNDANANPGALLGGFEFGASDILEVARGPQSTSFGGAAIGGVVAISSALSDAGTRVTARTEAGSFGTYRGRATVAAGSGRLRLVSSFSGADAKNERPDNAYDQRTQALRLEYRATPALAIGATIRGLQQSVVSPGDIRTSNTTPSGTTTFDHSLATLYLNAQPASRWSARLTLGGQGSFLRGKSRFNGGDEFVSRLKTTRRVADWQHRVAVSPTLAAIAGINAEWSDVTDNAGRRDERLRAGYAELTLTPNRNLVVSAGARRDDYTTFTARTTGRVTAAYFIPAADLKIRATIGTGFMPPSLAARYGSPFQKANPSLRPERSRGIDVGIDRFFDGGRAVASVTLFENRLTDLIGFESADYPELGRSINVARARTRGLEASAQAEHGAFDGRLSYTFTDAIDLDAPSAGEERLIRRPRHAVAADLGFRHQALSAGFGMFGALGREDSDFNAFPFRRVNPGDYVDARVYAGWRFGPGLVVEARVENVFGSRYEEAYGFPALGRRVTIGFGINR